MHRRPDCTLLRRQDDEFGPRDRCAQASVRAVFGVAWLILLHRWVHMVIVAFGVDQGVNFSCAVIAIFTVAGL